MRIPLKLIDEYGPQVGVQAVGVYMALCRFADSEDTHWPSHQIIADKFGISREQVMRAIQTLVAFGLIDSIPQYDEETGEQQSTLYVLLDISDSDIGEHKTVPDDTQSLPRNNSLTLRIKH